MRPLHPIYSTDEEWHPFHRTYRWLGSRSALAASPMKSAVAPPTAAGSPLSSVRYVAQGPAPMRPLDANLIRAQVGDESTSKARTRLSISCAARTSMDVISTAKASPVELTCTAAPLTSRADDAPP